MAITSGLNGAFEAGLKIYAFLRLWAIMKRPRNSRLCAKMAYLPDMRKLTFEEIQSRRLPAPRAAEVPRLPLRAILNNVRSLYNVGSIFRTADAYWLTELVLTGYTPRPPRREIEKTALGATKTVPWRYVQDPLEALQQIRAEGWEIWAVEQTTRSAPLPVRVGQGRKIALVFGNEVSGVDQQVLMACDEAVEIPMHGTKHSLNVAVAFGIAVSLVSGQMHDRPG